MDYVSWQQMGAPRAPYIGASPNVRLIMTELIRRFGGANWGIYAYRPIRGGTQWSTHAWGGAGDWAYQADAAARVAAIDWLIANHVALHVQMIVDEDNDRTWKSSRPEYGGAPGWRAGKITTGGPWLHFETTPDGWADATPISARLALPPVQPAPPQEEDDDMASTARIWGHPDFTNRWLVGTGSAMHLSGNLAKSYIDAGVPEIIEAHDQTLKTVLFQCGLTSADLVRKG